MKQPKNPASLIGKRVRVVNRDSWFFDYWGTVTSWDGECYGVAIANGTDVEPIFYADELQRMK